MSDISCKANGWAQNAFGTLGITAFSAFSALRAYALSDKNIWLTAMIIFLALPAPAIEIFLAVNIEFQTLPSPFNCVGSSKLSPTVYHIVYRIMRVSQLAAELLVVIITWWYTYQSYRIRKGLKIGKTISSLIIYNGSIYFLFFAGWYILDIIIDTASVSPQVVRVDSFLELFYDPIVSPFTCRFMLALRQFDSRTTSAVAYPGIGSTTLEFGTQPSDSFPGFIASFAHPLHVDSSPSETDSDGIIADGTEWREMDVRVE